MAATKQDIRRWLEEARKKGATHLIIVCDTFDNEDFPVFVRPGQNPREIAKKNNDGSKMLRVMEVYSLNRNVEEQLNEHGAFHYD